jgi:hypothetical protein
MSNNTYYGTNPSGTGGYWSLGGSVPIAIATASISTSATGDLATVATGLSRYIVSAVYVESLTAAGTMAAGTIDIRTATGGGGSSILSAPVALTGLTSTNLVQQLTVATLGAVQTAANLTLSQTVISLNAGTIGVVIILIPVP